MHTFFYSGDKVDPTAAMEKTSQHIHVHRKLIKQHGPVRDSHLMSDVFVNNTFPRNHSGATRRARTACLTAHVRMAPRLARMMGWLPGSVMTWTD